MDEEQIERRQYRRLKEEVSVELFYLDMDKSSVSTAATIVNISAGGLLVTVDALFKVGTSVLAKFTLPGGKEPFDFIARVVRVEELDGGGRFDIGLAFLDPDDERLDKIHEWVEREIE